MTLVYDVLVVGLGAMGSSTLYHLAARGCRVLGIDAFVPPHTLGSTHGRSRIIREAYFEHPSYVPLVQHAYRRWAELEVASGMTLFTRTGGLMMGAPDCGLVRGALASAGLHQLPVETLEAQEIMRRVPALVPDRDMVGVWERNAGILFPELCVSSYLRLAEAAGAHVRTGEWVTDVRLDGSGVSATSGGERINARKAVICAGAWASGLLASVGVTLPLVIERQTMHWFDSRDASDLVQPARLPIALIEHAPDRMFYVMPDLGDGMKAAIHHEGALVSPDNVPRDVTARDTKPVIDLARRFVPAGAGALRESAVCLYTNTPDFDFVIDTVPGAPPVVVVSACSGHGFKFASAIGEAAAQMSLGESPSLDLAHFSASRFS